MNRIAVAREILAVAKELMAIEFPTQDAFDKYMKEHPDANKSNHKVVEKKEENKSPKKTTKKDVWRDVYETMKKHPSGKTPEQKRKEMDEALKTFEQHRSTFRT